MFLILSFLFFIKVKSFLDSKIILDGDDWMITNGSMTKVKAIVPGGIYLPLVESNWNYTKKFLIDSSSKFLNNDIIQLVADGIDYESNIYINEKLVYNNNISFSNIINVKSYLVYGLNTILVQLYNKVSNVNDDVIYTVPTEPCSFSWNWSPVYLPAGIWKSIYLQGYNTAVIRSVFIYATPVNSSRIVDYTKWKTQVVVAVDAGKNVLHPSPDNHKSDIFISGKIQITIDSINKIFTKSVTLFKGVEQNFTVDLGVLADIIPWMPNEFGEQKLYTFKVNFEVNNILDEGKEKVFGFKEIKQIEETLPGGRLFYFRINGVNISINGSNWIPKYALDNLNYNINTESLTQLFVALYNSDSSNDKIYQEEAENSFIFEYGKNNKMITMFKKNCIHTPQRRVLAEDSPPKGIAKLLGYAKYLSPIPGLASNVFTVIQLISNWGEPSETEKILKDIKTYLDTAFNQQTIRDQTSKISTLLSSLNQFTEHIDELNNDKQKIVQYIESDILNAIKNAIGPNGDSKNAVQRLKIEWDSTPWTKCNLLSPTLKALSSSVLGVVYANKFLVMMNAQRVAYYQSIGNTAMTNSAKADYDNALIDYGLWINSQNLITPGFVRSLVNSYVNHRKAAGHIASGTMTITGFYQDPCGKSITCKTTDTQLFGYNTHVYDNQWDNYEFYSLYYFNGGGFEWWVKPEIIAYIQNTILPNVHSIEDLDPDLTAAVDGYNAMISAQ